MAYSVYPGWSGVREKADKNATPWKDGQFSARRVSLVASSYHECVKAGLSVPTNPRVYGKVLARCRSAVIANPSAGWSNDARTQRQSHANFLNCSDV